MATKRLSQEAALTVVKRSMPNRARPRLSTEVEVRLADVEDRCAEAYASMEMATQSLHELAAAVESSDAIPVPVPESWEDTSAVHHVEDVRAHTEGAKKTP